MPDQEFPTRNEGRVRTANQPTSTGLELAIHEEASDAGSSRMPSRLAHQARPIRQYQADPTSSRLLPPPTTVPWQRLPPAPPDRYDDQAMKVSHLHPDKVRSTRGALPALPPVGFPEPPPEPGVHR